MYELPEVPGETPEEREQPARDVEEIEARIPTSSFKDQDSRRTLAIKAVQALKKLSRTAEVNA